MELANKARTGRRIALEALAESRANGNLKGDLELLLFKSVRPLVLQDPINNVVDFNEIVSERRLSMSFQAAS